MYWGGQIALHLALPLIAALLIWRGVREPGHLRGLRDRFGLGPTGPKGAVWVYAASLGETRAASPLIALARQAGHPVLLTHLSPAGLAEGWRLFPDDPGITHRYMPIDLFWAVRLFLARAQPRLGVVMEIEIWPAMLIEARRAGVPMVMANGNLVQQSIDKARGMRRHLLRLYREFTHIFTRTDAFRDRYVGLGVDPARISVVGELKYDQQIDPAQPQMGARLRARWHVARVLMIASSVQGEEGPLLAMARALLAQDAGLGIVWVPRSPQRFDPLAAALQSAQIPTIRRSALGPDMGQALPPGTRIILGDTLGEMNAFYPMADLVFVGASLVDHGGHNIMEPMAHGKPVVMGPSIYGIAFAAEPAAQAGAFESLPDADTLQARIAALLADAPARAAMGHAAASFAAAQTGAARATWAGIEALLPPRQP